MREVPLRASVVGLTARCDRHVDVTDVFQALHCPDCRRRIFARALAEVARTRREDAKP